ncbi:alpha/beta hydrolase [Candidatus Uhrbacteria bacterium]|nr:alpha/beta hydrolase [Candidatus Uhrbacteria bacterium]
MHRLILALMLVGLGCTPAQTPMPDRVTMTTTDGVEIVGSFVRNNDQKAAILLHMMPADRTSWSSFAKALNGIGYASLAIDERGHGESTMNGTLNYKNFTDEQQQAKILDVEAALAYLEGEGFSKENIVVVGASIGANLAIEELTRHPELPIALALSPGLDYRGIKTDELVTKLQPSQKVILVASDEDRESYKSILKLHELNPTFTTLIERSGIGHGTDMIDADPSLLKDLIERLP